ncbi:MAG: 3-methyl-2-oxobutanoate hydroxymethyltransferase [Sulfurospirillum sp.]|nr:3-methyl-2-oxobutanoate hydroxymethyltransferase [Sulfurospirillum sp.]MBL0702711.1 3-methyl-2-oxobutanoate hydroxymethyltransferase [Sulfurospirillum sp.]
MQTVASIKKAKNGTPLTAITAYDSLFASLFNKKIDMILVGDSLNMSFNNKPDTLSATLDMMIYHTNAVCKGAPDTFIICDMPFGTYTNKKQAIKNASRVYQETDAHALKIEGGAEHAHIIKSLTCNSIAVMGHIGLMPQHVRAQGGYKIRGKNEKDTQQLICDAKAIEKAGAFCIVIEGVKSEATKRVNEEVSIPTIGIGAGNDTDGQILVWSDMLGFFQEFQPKFVKKYLNGADIVKNAIDTYVKEVKTRKFPTKEYTY